MKGIINFKNEKTLKIVVLVGVGLILIIFWVICSLVGNNTKPVQPVARHGVTCSIGATIDISTTLKAYN